MDIPVIGKIEMLYVPPDILKKGHNTELFGPVTPHTLLTMFGRPGVWFRIPAKVQRRYFGASVYGKRLMRLTPDSASIEIVDPPPPGPRSRSAEQQRAYRKADEAKGFRVRSFRIHNKDYEEVRAFVQRVNATRRLMG